MAVVSNVRLAAVVLPPPTPRLAVTHAIRLFDGIGLPPGVVDLAAGGPATGTALTAHPGIDLVSFTGSDRVGSAILAQAAPTLTRCVLELGEKAASIVLQGADLRAAAEASVTKFVRNSGQVCGAWTRLLVHENDTAEFVQHARKAVAELTVGDPRDPATTVGPLVTADHLARVSGQVDAARRRGATVLAEGSHHMLRGHYMSPILLGDLPLDDPVIREELFGPVAALLP